MLKQLFLSGLLGICVFASPSLAQLISAHPNIVVILADDLGYGDVSFNGCPDFSTPNIDSIASNGVSCPDGYVTHPFCSPSRAGLLTGRYQQRFGHENQPEYDATNPLLGLPMEEILLPQILKPAGYVCGAIGKWHLGYAPNFHPLARGFDEFFGFLGADSPYYNAQILDGYTTITETAYLTDAFTREAVSFIDRHATQPFFLYLPYNAVHSPFDRPPQIYLDRVGNITDPARKIYAAMATAMDDGVGQVLEALQANNLLENTLIFFVSDNGGGQQSAARNYPLRGYKLNVLEGGIRVPFAVQWTGRLPAHSVYDEPVSSLDIVATAAAAAGVPLPADRVYDGLDIVPYLTGKQVSPPRNLFWRWFGLGPDGPSGSVDTIWAVRSGPLKLITERDSVGRPPALYNLLNDIGETQDLSATQPVDVNALQQLYAQWDTQTVPPLWQNTHFNISQFVLAGDWNGFNKGDTAHPWAVTRTTAPGVNGTPDGFTWFTTTIHAAARGGDTTPGMHSFVLVGDNTFNHQWGGGTITIDGISSLQSFVGTVLGPTSSISLADGSYYSFRILDPLEMGGPTNFDLSVMKTSAPPVSVNRSGQTPLTPTSDEPVLVSITTDQQLSAEEKIYLRWSTDTFITSSLVPANGSATNYSATIPPQPAGTLVQYSVITSTVDLAPFVTSRTIDLLTLADTVVFGFVVSGAPGSPVITTQPANKTVAAGRTAKFKVIASGDGTLSYQWKKNGTDIAGARKASYTTPATTLADSGALFAVLVSNSTGTVTSNSAVLTVNASTPPSIITQPVSKSVTAGKTAKFSVVATGDAPLSYQWRRNSLAIAGATAASYTTPPTKLADNGVLFSVVVTNNAGSVTSNDATLTVKP